jgi:antitoxin ParD1/3/4
MPTVTISLPEPLREFIDHQVKTKGYGNVSEYFRGLLREAQEREDRQRESKDREAEERESDKRLEALLLASLDDSRPDVKITPEFWDRVKRRFEGRIERRSRSSRKK